MQHAEFSTAKSNVLSGEWILVQQKEAEHFKYTLHCDSCVMITM